MKIRTRKTLLKAVPVLGSAIAIAVMSFAYTAKGEANDDDARSLVKQAEMVSRSASDAVKTMDIKQPDAAVSAFAQEVLRNAGAARSKGTTVVNDAFGIAQPPEQPPEVFVSGEWVDIFISRSLGESAIKSILRDAASENVSVRFVFRGIPEGRKINAMFTDYQRWTTGMDTPPPAVLDPTVFQDAGVSTVPVMILRKDGDEVARVSGLTSAKWLFDKVRRGQEGDLGTKGPVEAISEPDLIEVMKAKAAQLDLDEQKKRTVETYWDRVDFLHTEPARQDRRRLIDPTIVVQDDMKDHQGEVIYPAGHRINPLSIKAFTNRLIVFNPTREAELTWLKSLEPIPGIQDVYIATDIEARDGWDGFTALEDRIDQPVYLLQNDVQSRFEIERTPSLVTADQVYFIVEEFHVQEEVIGDDREAIQ